VNLEGHTSQVSSASADFLISGSVAAVIDQAVAMSSEPDGHELMFPSVNMPSVAALLASSEPAPATPVDVPTTQSSSPILGFGPPLTDGFVDAGFGSVFKTIGFTGAIIQMAGTSVWWLSSKKQATLAYSTTESKLCAAAEISKFIKRIRVLMADVGLPHCTAIFVGEDNAAA
jgi:hypothetical protein